MAIDMNAVLEKYEVSKTGEIYSLRRKRNLTPALKKHGYYEVVLTLNGKKHFVLLHRLVAMVYLPNEQGLPCVNHKDLNRLNNIVDNLEWCSYQHNNQNRGNNKLSIGDENKIRAQYKRGFTQQHIADLYGLDQGYVSQIINFKRR